MKIEIVKNNKILVNSSKENFEIHPLWLRERAKTEKLVDKHNDQRLYDPSQLDENVKIKKTVYFSDLKMKKRSIKNNQVFHFHN